VPPFSILDTKQGYWLDRKKYWKNLIGDNGETRENLISDFYGTSILDPVLAEISNRWFGIDNGNTFDCFAGDSVFGYVSDALGNKFTGIELRQEQADLNNERLKGSKSKYICDDGVNVLKHIPAASQDLLFSCPPYYDLEVYSELENDASNQNNYKDFLKIINKAFTGAIKCLKEDRFAVIVVGDIRDEKGFYYGFVDDVKNIFLQNGLQVYNEMIIAESLGTLPQRVGRYMNNRKIGKCHQNILVFYKGNPKNIKNNYKKLDFTNLDESTNI
jgi:DNA modification methylase